MSINFFNPLNLCDYFYGALIKSQQTCVTLYGVTFLWILLRAVFQVLRRTVPRPIGDQKKMRHNVKMIFREGFSDTIALSLECYI